MKVLHHARIYTLDAHQPVASALVVEGERVAAVGDERLVEDFAHAERQDMAGGVILPGLSDAHLHLQQYALGLRKVDCQTRTLDECLRRVQARARATRAGEWILGHGWDQNLWGQWPTAADLDRVAPNHPTFLTARSLHAAWVNGAALKQAGLDTASADPPNGRIQRDQHGRPTGILLEAAMERVSRLIPAPGVEEIASAIEQAQPSLWQVGLTGVHDFDRREAFLALQKLHAEERLRLRVTKSLPLELLDLAIGLGLRSGFGDDWLRIGSVKVFLDGALGPHTAAMFQPYEGEPHNLGMLNMDGEQLFEQARRAAQAGLSLAVHAIGDRANHEALNAYEQLRLYEQENGLPPLRHRIEHVQLLHPDDARRLAQLNVVASMQPIHAISDMEMAERYWGERTRLAYAWRSQLEAGARLAFGSDAPVEAPNPFWGLHAAVTRRRPEASSPGWHPEQCLTLQQALEGFTRGAAYAAGMEGRLGKLAPGFLADLIVLERDPFACEPDELRALRPSAVMIGGAWVF